MKYVRNPYIAGEWIGESPTFKNIPKTNLMSVDWDLVKKQKPNFFSLDILKILPEYNLIQKLINIWIINTKKGTGKTHWIMEQTNAAVERMIIAKSKGNPIVERFVLMWRTKTHGEEMINEINESSQHKYIIKKSKIWVKESNEDKIISCGMWVGDVVFLGTAHNHASKQFVGFNRVYFDEYRSKIALSIRQKIQEPIAFGTFIDTFQRDKKMGESKFYLFGNNEKGADSLAESWEIDKKQEIFIYPWKSLLYMNFQLQYGKQETH